MERESSVIAKPINKARQTGKIKFIIAALLLFLVIAAFFYLIIIGIKSDYYPSMTLEEIESTDLSTTTVPIGPALADWYPDKLYTPEDFSELKPDPGEGKAMYGTYRIELPLPKGKTYGITGLTCSYAQKVYINGALLSEVGKVSDSPEAFVARTDTYSIFFTPQTDVTEIVVQFAHFNNKNGYFNQVFLGEQEVVVATSRSNFLSSGLIVGTLFAFAIFFLGMFLFYPKKKHLLWFALMCFFSGLYFLIFQNKDIMAIFPNLPWAVSHKTEYLSQLATYVFLICYAVSMTKLKLGKWQMVLFWIAVGGVMLFYIIAPSTFYSYHKKLPMRTYATGVVTATLYIIWKAFRSRIFKHTDNIIVIACLALGVGVYAFDFITDRNYNVMPFGTMVTVFFGAVAITIQFSRSESELILAQIREREITESNIMLERMGELKNNFLHNIAHEMKTPLTVMSGYAQLTDWQLKEGTTDESILYNLQIISNEAERLSDMVTRLLALSFDKELYSKKIPIDAKKLLENTVAVCRPILKKNQNRLELNCKEIPPLYANSEALLQVLVNLTINASKHTEKGVISISVSRADKMAAFKIEDSGTGISPEILPHIFEKGVSGDKSTGLGLAISKEIIEQNGGTIQLEYTGAQGTCFSFTVPLFEEAEDE